MLASRGVVGMRWHRPEADIAARERLAARRRISRLSNGVAAGDYRFPSTPTRRGDQRP